MDPIAEILSRELFGIKLGLASIGAICEALDRPERAYRTLIVGGTNGKGSVTAMTAAGLDAAGIRTGRYTSPHLTRIEERFVIGGRPVDAPSLERAGADVLAAEARCLAMGTVPAPATFFELTTATAFSLFRDAGVQVAVLEVGLGGQFDATNVASSVAGVITNIDLDHTEQLGPTIEAIAAAKAGIIKPGMTIVTAERKPEALEVIAAACRDRGATLLHAGSAVATGIVLDGDGRTSLELRTPGCDYGRVTLALRGRHQIVNALVAARFLESLVGHAMPVPVAAIRAGLEGAVWPGRLQYVDLGGGRRALVDCAHNPAGARALAAYLRETTGTGVPIVFGAMHDKDVDGMLAPLAPLASLFVMTRPSHRRAEDPDALAASARRAGATTPIEIEPDPLAAVRRALASAPLAVVTGSIFLVGELLPQITGGEAGAPA